MTTPIGDIFIGAVRIPLSAAFELSQTYGPIGGFILLRTLNGSAIKQQNWQKISTSISGSGAIPVGLDEIDFKLSQVLRCGASKGVTSSSNIMTLPPGRRSDPGFEEVGCFSTDNGVTWQPTGISIISDVATLVTDPGAQLYRVEYYPEITVFADPPEESTDSHGRVFGWTINAEEV